ncbi:carboxylating nicotinate-nucleotide diphosphorylase [Candidatus Pelagibacter sp. HIMB1517]|uniref:carboxylating nicotinate-nucleotide diphosphorylase n=1 Tax=Candidatus Pelagibacter sp. HIMB1517 TaxID=3413341 RepID=UPI003F841219
MSENQIKQLINLSIQEDKVHQDITSKLTIPNNLIVSVNIVSKGNGILFGVNIVKKILKTIDKKIKIKIFKSDGKGIKKGNKIINLKGKGQSILKSERIILNFLGHLSGVASETKKLVNQTKKYKTKICCTRKTLPGMRYLQKLAIKAGGGFNNRYDLEQEIFIKDNHHLDKVKFRDKIIQVIKKNKNKKIINAEVDNLNQLKQIVDLKIDRILLDNFSTVSLKKALRIIPKTIQTEASGNINPKNFIQYARTGVKRISLGYLTHSVKNFDFSLEF